MHFPIRKQCKRGLFTMTDYHITGKLYKKLDAFIEGNCTQAMPYPESLYYFGSSIQFKTCKSFKAYLSSKYPNKRIAVSVAK